MRLRGLIHVAVVAATLLAGCGDGGSDTPTVDAMDAMPDAMDVMPGVMDAMPDAMPDASGDDSDAMLNGIDATPEPAPDAFADPPDAEPDDCAVALVAGLADGRALDPLDPLHLGVAAARGPALRVTLELTNRCGRRLRFLGHPDAWIAGDGFELDSLPPILLEPGESTALGLRFTPESAGEARGRLTLPYDRPGAPLELELVATVEAARRVVFVGDGRHVVTTADYGTSVAHDAFETLQAHGDALQRGICWGAGRFVAVGGNVDSRWWTSDDGVEWQAHRADTGVMAGCAYGNGRFVAAAGQPLHSVDGLEWTPGRDDGFVPQHLRAMTYGGGVFVAVGDEGRVASTVDGSGWDSDAVLGIGGLMAVTWGGGRFVAVGQGGATATSVDGVDWTPSSVAEAGDLAGVAFADGRFVAGDGGRVYASVDGVTWQPVNAASAVPRVGFGRMIFGTDGGELYRSEDGGFSWSEWHVSAGGLGLSDAAVEGL